MKNFKINSICIYIIIVWFFSFPAVASKQFGENYSLFNISPYVNDNIWEIGSIVARGHRDLAKVPGVHLQPDGTFLFESSNSMDKQTDYYTVIRGTLKDDIIRFNGRFIINELNLLGGKNTLILEQGTVFLLNPGIGSADPKSLKFYNIANFDIKQGVKIQFLNAIYGLHDININFSSSDSSVEKNNIIMQDFSLVNNKTDQKGYININNAFVQVQHDLKGIGGNFILSSNQETLNLADAKIDSNGLVDEKTRSKLLISKGFSKPGGVFILNMGKYSNITTHDGAMQINSSTIINMDKSSSIDSNLIFSEGNTNINIKENTKVSDPIKDDNNKEPITIRNITFNDGNNVINVAHNASFLVMCDISNSAGNLKIFVGKNSDFTVRGRVGVFGSNNYVSLDEQSILNADLTFTSASFNNKVVVNTGNSFVTLNGFLNASSNNDTLTLLGKGVFKINTSSIAYNPLNGFNTFKLNQARLEINGNYRQRDGIRDINVVLGLLPNISTEEEKPRIWFKNQGRFGDYGTDTNINLKYKGVTEYLGKVNDKYILTLFRVEGKEDFTKLSDIGLKDINFTSSIYKLKYNIEQNRDVKLELEKYRTFKDALLQDGNVTHKEEYVVQIANWLDILIEERNEKYFDFLDELAMLDIYQLKKSLQGCAPVNNTILFNVNNSIANEFNQVILDDKPYKIVRNEITLWSNYTYFITEIKNFNGAKLTSNNQLMFGAEYSLLKFLKLGGSIGYSRPRLSNKTGLYDADVNNYYYSAYSLFNITSKLSLDCNVGFLNSNYNLNRYISIENYKSIGNNKITSNPKFNQVNLDTLFSYKIKLDDLLVVPYVSFSYTDASMGSYVEKGEKMIYGIAKSNFNEYKAGFGFKALTVNSFAGGIIIPNLVIGLYASSQNTESTKAQHIDSPNIWSPFTTDDYGGLYGKCKIGFTYRLKDIITLDLSTGFNIGKSLKSYNFGTSIKITL